jgi:hypothetical protein
MAPRNIYYLATLPILVTELILFWRIGFPFEVHLSFLIVYTFALFFEHPNIDEYKENQRKRFSLVFQLLSLWNFFDLNIPEMKLRDFILRHAVGGLLFCMFFIFANSLWNILGAAIGIVCFELSRQLFIKFMSRSLNS